MSNNIETTRAPFFPNSKNDPIDRAQNAEIVRKRNTIERAKELKDISRDDAKVDIPLAIKDFSRIKKAVDMAPPVDNSAKIAQLKSQINSGTYNIDYDAVADRLLGQEF